MDVIKILDHYKKLDKLLINVNIFKKEVGGEIMKKETVTSPDGNITKEFEDGKLKKVITKKVVEETKHISGTHMVVPANNNKEVYIGYLEEVSGEDDKQVAVLDDATIVTKDGCTKKGKMVFLSKSVLRIEVDEYVLGDTSYIR